MYLNADGLMAPIVAVFCLYGLVSAVLDIASLL